MIASKLTKKVAQPLARRVTGAGGGEGSAAKYSLFSGSGQSLYLGSVGGGGTPSVVSVGSIAKSRMLSPGGTRPRIDDVRVTVDAENVFADRFASIATLAESVSSNFGETYATGVAAQNSDRDVLHTGIGRGAQTIAQLSLGSYFFADLMVAINRAKLRMDAADIGAFDWPIHRWAQGEADTVGGTTYAAYRASVVQYFSDLKEFGNAQLDGSYAPKFIVYQHGNPYVSASVENWGPADALLDVGLNESDMFCVGPAYQVAYEDSAHMTSLSYRRFGEQIGKVIDQILSGVNWKPLHWTNAVRTGSTIALTYHVPSGILTKDTTNVSDPGDNGFEYSGANITAVTITGDNTIDITLDSASAGTLGYARTQTTTNSLGPTTGARGNIRDSDTTTAVHDSFNLYNWACHQEEVIA